MQQNYSNPAIFTTNKIYPSHGPTLSFSQSLFDWSTWKTYTSTQYNTKADAITFSMGVQQLMSQTVSDYFLLLNRKQILDYSISNKNWLKALHQQSIKRLNANLISKIDVMAAQAQYDKAVAQAETAKTSLLESQYKLQELTGKDIEKIYTVVKSFKFTPPNPDNLKSWLKTGSRENLQIVKNQFLLQAAENNISLAVGNFLPNLSLTGALSKTTSFQSNPYTGEPEAIQPTQGSVGLISSWNLIKGGADYAKVRKNKYFKTSSQHTLRQSELAATRKIKQAFLNVNTSISVISSYHNAVQSGLFAVKAMKKKYEAGVVTIVDLLHEQQQLVLSQNQYAKSKYKYISDMMNLKLQAGVLSLYDIEYINSWLIDEAI